MRSPTLEEAHGFLQGEKVAFGIICLLTLENRRLPEIAETIRFCRALGLPTKLPDLHIVDGVREKAQWFAEAALKGTIVYATPVKLSTDLLGDAILTADAIGRAVEAGTA